MLVDAKLENIRITPRKMRQVAPIVRGMRVSDALNHLSFTPKTAAQVMTRVIKNARANAVNAHKLDAEKLVIKEIEVSDGPTYKRGRPVARGTYHPIFKRTSHLKVVLEG